MSNKENLPQNQIDNAQMANFFVAVDSNAHKEILNYLKTKTVDVTFKVYDLHSKSLFVQVENSDLAILRKFPYDYEITTIYCSIIYKGETHFFKSKLTTSANYFLVKFPKKIYKIQRRADFRFLIPLALEYQFKVFEYRDLKATLIDISLGGCRVSLATSNQLDINGEADLTVHLKILNFEAAKIYTTVAFTKFYPDKQSQIIGLKFESLDAESISSLHTNLIQVDRISRGKMDI